MSRFANLADKPRVGAKAPQQSGGNCTEAPALETMLVTHFSTPPSRVGRKAIAAYFSHEMSLAMHVCARRNGLSLQELMAEAFDDVLRKYGESPIGK
jgi:hypothetical protein